MGKVCINFSFLFNLILGGSMLEDLKILNGEMSLKFNPYNTKYTIVLNDYEDMELEMEYRLTDKAQIFISGNYLDKNYNEVILSVSNEKETVNYYLYVYKEKATNVNDALKNYEALEVMPKKEISPYAAPGISVTCFLLILILFSLLFHKKKRN